MKEKGKESRRGERNVRKRKGKGKKKFGLMIMAVFIEKKTRFFFFFTDFAMYGGGEGRGL